MQFIAPYSQIPTGSLVLRLHPAHLADLRSSGIRHETIIAHDVHTLRPSALTYFFGHVPDQVETALCFPYPGHRFARIKLFPPFGKQKYAQPRGTGARLYMAGPLTAGAIYVCEGEKKTLAARQIGLNAVGVGGVWNWLSSGKPIDDLNLIEWDTREVILVPDSDVFCRTDLLRAIYALGRELQARGAAIYVAQIPDDGTIKVGLDDFLVLGGRISALEIFALSHRIFKGCSYWHGQWKFKKTIRPVV